MPALTKIQEERMRLFFELVKKQKGCRILDIGCQSGAMCHLLSQNGYKPYGIDIMSDLIDSAKSKYPSLNFQWADCEKSIPFEDNFFDVIWAGDVIEHIRFTDVFVNEVNRVLRKGGLFVLTTPMHNRLKNVIIALHNFENHFNPEGLHLRFYTITSLRSVLEKRGFKLNTVKYIGRIRPVAMSMLVIGEKVEDKQLCSLLCY